MKIFSKMLKSIIHRDKGKLIRSALYYFSAVPLFRLQSTFSRSYIPLPHLVVIEPTNRCNLNCVMCARRYWDASKNPFGDMTFDFFQSKVLPNLKPFQNVNLQCFGEPLVHKEFLSMLKASKDLGCWTTFTTNGVLLKEYAEDIVSIGVDKIMISIDGIEAMNKFRNIKIEKVIDAIDAINEAKKMKKISKPLLEVNTVLTRDSLPELPLLVELVGKHGVTSMNVFNIVAHDRSLIEQSVIPIYDQAERYLQEAASIADNYGITLCLPPKPGTRFKCREPFSAVVINWDGTVRPCCESTINEKNELKVGNLNDSPLIDLWNSSYMHTLRKSLLTEKNLPQKCINCRARSCTLESHTQIMRDS